MNTHDAYAAVQEAIAAGRAWGEQEVELWKDQHNRSFAEAPAWTRGTYCGHLPADETRGLIEAVIDLEAERVWNVARETEEERVMAKAGKQKRKCAGRTADNYACEHHARPGSEWCYWHDPAAEETRKALSQARLRTINERKDKA